MKLTNVLEIILYVIIILAGIPILNVVLDYMKAKIDTVQTNTKIAEYKKFNEYIDSAQDAIRTAVLTVSQTYVDSLKASGGFDKEAQKVAKLKAINIAKSLMSDDIINAINVVHKDYDAYIDNAIEEMCKMLKMKYGKTFNELKLLKNRG